LGTRKIRINAVNPGMIEAEGFHAAGFAELRRRFKRAIADDDLPADADADADADALARYVQTVNFGLTVQASTGATRKELLRIVEITMKTWPK
jgi:NAD(P)-dependent dehydrogenase (short-subunit alcohol dehydrogenase family)